MDFDTMPVILLSQPTICALCEMLDPEKLKKNDYRLLVNYLCITFDEMKKLRKDVEKSNYKSMTLLLLRKWVAQENVYVQTLFDLLRANDRCDVIREITGLAEQDLQKAKNEGNSVLSRLQESESEPWDGFLEPTVDDCLFSSDIFQPGRTFDAFISYNPKSSFDQEQMEALKKDLCSIELKLKNSEKNFLNVVVGAEELLSGTDLSKSLVRALRFRCKRVVLLISRSFGRSDECVFQMQIAKGMDLASRYRKVIPVIIEKGAELPDEIFNLSAVDLTNPSTRRSQMLRLAASLIG